MRRKVWALGGAAAVVMIVVALVERHAAAQASRPQVPLFEPDPLWSQALPNKWVTGQVGWLAVDSHDNLWVFHRPAPIPDGEKAASLIPPQAECCIPAPAVLEFDTNGKFLQAWGGAGQGYEWPASEHGIFVDDSSNDTENLGGPAGLFVYRKTNELFVADGYFNHRVIVFDADTGAYKRHWGAYGKKPDDGLKFPPRAQLVQGPPPEGFNNPVHAVLVTNDDLVYVADRSNNRLQVFRLDGTFIKEVFISRNTLQNEGTVHAFAASPDKEQKFLYIADGSNKAIRVVNRQTLEMVSSVGGHAGHNAREFFHIHSFATDSKGNLFLGEVNNGQRYYKYAFKGMGR